MNDPHTALQIRTAVPDELLQCHPTEVHALIGGPSLFHLSGRDDKTVFITVLQHGNEPTGFEAMQQILNKYKHSGLPRNVWLFISNTEAAAAAARHLPHQADFNRVWPNSNSSDVDGVEAQLMRQVVETVTQQPLLASIDLHNNTGRNPHYACINALEARFFNLARLFDRTVVYFRRPQGAQSIAMAEHCPAVTLECGQTGQSAALEHAFEFIDACLHIQELSARLPKQSDIHLLNSAATVKIKPSMTFSFTKGADANMVLRDDLDRFNFGCLPAGSVIAELSDDCDMPLTVKNARGEELASQYFHHDNNRLIASQDLIPSMATLDEQVIQQDCLFYLMQEITLHQAVNSTILDM